MKSLLKKVSTGLTTAAGTALYGYTVFAQGTGFLSPTDSPGRIANATGGESSARNLILTIVNFFLGFLGLIAVLMVIYGGVLIVTSSGDPGKADKGKKILTYAAMGIIIILLSFAIVSTILGAGSGQDA